MLCDFPLHSIPPEFLLQILIHLLTARVNRIGCLMGFLEDQLPNRLDHITPSASSRKSLPLPSRISRRISLIFSSFFCASLISRSKVGSNSMVTPRELFRNPRLNLSNSLANS